MQRHGCGEAKTPILSLRVGGLYVPTINVLLRVQNSIRLPFQSLAYHLPPVKDKKTAETFSVEGLRKPEFVVLPHLGERKLAEIEPERCSLFCFDRHPIKFRSDKHSA